MTKSSEPWEFEAYKRAERADAHYSPQMRSWSSHFRAVAFWRRYVQKWREAKPEDE